MTTFFYVILPLLAVIGAPASAAVQPSSALTPGSAPGDGRDGAATLPRPPVTAKDPAELCDRLAGTERDICLDRARDGRRSSEPPLGGTPGASPPGIEKPVPDRRGPPAGPQQKP